MGAGRLVFSTFDKVFDRVLCVAGAVLFSQAPEFMQQYLQRLGGHLDEARRQLRQFNDVAAQAGLSLQQLIEQTRATAGQGVAKLADVMQEAEVRVASLETAQIAIQHASPLERPFVFLRHADHEIAQATWRIFQPAVPTTIEGALYALLGVMTLLAIYHGLIKAPVSRVLARRRVKAAPLVA